MSSVVFALVLGLTGVLGEISVKSNEKEVVGQSASDRACFARIGCFDLGEPWSRQNRVPPPTKPNRETAVLYFYSRRNSEKPYKFRTYPDLNMRGAPFDGRRPTAVIIHGYQQNASFEWVQTMKYFYLLDFDSNVLIADFSRACGEDLVQCVGNARIVGKLIARLLENLIVHRNLTPGFVHLIGHGLGAQIASYVAKEIPGISRLTALDPQQPLFEGHDRRTRLDKSDAAFVEVVHTNAIPYENLHGYGLIQPHGHVDFYFNDGGNQPGCLLPPGFPKLTRLADVTTLLSQYRKMKNSCNQNKAYDYLVEAYNPFADCVFWGHRVPEPPTADSPGLAVWKNFLSFLRFDSSRGSKQLPCTEYDCILFGYDTIQSPLRGVFVIRTDSKPPYCIPEPGPKRRDRQNRTINGSAELSRNKTALIT